MKYTIISISYLPVGCKGTSTRWIKDVMNITGNKNNIKDAEEKTTKEKIFEAAINLFAQKGFDATSMREIAEVVGIKKASMYSHYKSKDEILEKIVEHPLIRVMTIGQADVETEELIVTMGVDGFMNLSGETFTKWIEDPSMEKIFRIILIELYHNPQVKKFYLELWGTAYTFWESNFNIMMRNELIKPYDPNVLAMEFISFFQSAFTDYFLVGYGNTSGSFGQEYHERFVQHTEFIMNSIKRDEK
ncbi:TetR/AcrR family transcriptional regulator [Methanobacterium sp.]|uniref:TetR/AcrR family transcriptional regulator n=1 Tax=Methanobacterium sp. TaxID=2164 RepID=UPI003C77184C